ncbi:hypothetical protein P7L78_02430 (plasmid) [Tistrella bauzanensis]
MRASKPPRRPVRHPVMVVALATGMFWLMLAVAGGMIRALPVDTSADRFLDTRAHVARSLYWLCTDVGRRDQMIVLGASGASAYKPADRAALAPTVDQHLIHLPGTRASELAIVVDLLANCLAPERAARTRLAVASLYAVYLPPFKPTDLLTLPRHLAATGAFVEGAEGWQLAPRYADPSTGGVMRFLMRPVMAGRLLLGNLDRYVTRRQMGAVEQQIDRAAARATLIRQVAADSGNPEADPEAAFTQLAQALERWRSRGGQVVLVQSPVAGEVLRAVPAMAMWPRSERALAARHGVAAIDLVHSADDDEFRDGFHARDSAAMLWTERLMRLLDQKPDQ